MAGRWVSTFTGYSSAPFALNKLCVCLYSGVQAESDWGEIVLMLKAAVWTCKFQQYDKEANHISPRTVGLILNNYCMSRFTVAFNFNKCKPIFQVRGLCKQFVSWHILWWGVIYASPNPPQLKDHQLSAVGLLNIFAATLHIVGSSSIRNLRTRHTVVTGTHSGEGPVAGACEYGNDPSGSIKCGEFLD